MTDDATDAVQPVIGAAAMKPTREECMACS